MKRSQVERIADAIKFLVPVGGSGAWTPHGIATVKWPKDFSDEERKTIRTIVRTVIAVLEK